MVSRAETSEPIARSAAATRPGTSAKALGHLPLAPPAVSSDAYVPQLHTVVSGETLGKIAQRYGVSVATLLEANPDITATGSDRRRRSSDGHWIYPGDQLKIPARPQSGGATAEIVQRARAAQTRQLPARPEPLPATPEQLPDIADPAPEPEASHLPPPPPQVPKPERLESRSESASGQPGVRPAPTRTIPTRESRASHPLPSAVKAVGSSFVDVAAEAPTSAWRSPTSDGSWQSPRVEGSGPPMGGPAIYRAHSPTEPGPIYYPPTDYHPPREYYPPTDYHPPYGYQGDGYRRPRSDGDTRYRQGGSHQTYPYQTPAPTASGSATSEEALIVGGILAVAGLFIPTLVGTEIERSIGQAAAREALQQYPPYRGDPRLNRYVQGVVDRLASNRERKDIHYQVQVLDSNEPNAFAVPGGYVFVTTGALRLMNSEAELAGVLGHEIQHVEKRHGIKALQKQLVGMGIAVAAMGQTNSEGLQTAGALALGLALKGWSRADENEADEGGVRLAAKASYDPRGLVQFLDKLRFHEGPSLEIASDHPATENRIRKVNKQIADEGLMHRATEIGTDRFNHEVHWLRRGW